MFGGSAYGSQQQRPAGDGFWLGRAAVPAPPIVNQCHNPSTALAAFDVLGGKAAPAPLILEFVEAVVGIGPVAVQLRQQNDAHLLATGLQMARGLGKLAQRKLRDGAASALH